MTKSRLWWFVKEEDGIYIHVTDPHKKGIDTGSPLRQHSSSPHVRVSHEVGHITGVSVVASNHMQQRKKLVEPIMASIAL